MINLKLIIGILFLTLTSFKCYSQEYTLEKKTVTGVFDAERITKSEIFSSINKWISLNYNSALSVVQLNDKEAGNIILKGINEAVYKNVAKEFYPNNKYLTEFYSIKFNHTIEINVKDNKYRILYTLTGMIDEDNAMDIINNMVFDLIDFTGLKQEPVDTYNNYIDDQWKKALMGKNKREKIQERTRPVFEDLNKSVLADIKLTMLSIEKTVKSTKNDEW